MSGHQSKTLITMAAFCLDGMSVREFPSKDSSTRQERADETTIHEIREIDGSQFDAGEDATVYELDLTNERGARRENIVVIPRILFENTKDVQHRHNEGIVGKYTRALAQVSDQARNELFAGLEEERQRIQEEKRTLSERDSRLMHTQADIELL